MKTGGFCIGFAVMLWTGATWAQGGVNDTSAAIAKPAAAAADATDAEVLRRGKAVAYGSPAIDQETGEVYTRQIIEGHKLPLTAEQQRAAARAAARRAASSQAQPPMSAGEAGLDRRAVPSSASPRAPRERTSGLALDARDANADMDGLGDHLDRYLDRFAPAVIAGMALIVMGLLYFALRALRKPHLSKADAGAQAQVHKDSLWGRKTKVEDERAPQGPRPGEASSEQRAASNRREKDLAQCYRILGLQPSATIDEVKAAYKRHAQQHHPDKVASLGQELRDLAAAKSAEINGAYEAIKAALETQSRRPRWRVPR